MVETPTEITEQKVVPLNEYPANIGAAHLDGLVQSLASRIGQNDITFLHRSVFGQPITYLENTILEGMDVDAINRQIQFNEKVQKISLEKAVVLDTVKSRVQQDDKSARAVQKKKNREVKEDSQLSQEQLRGIAGVVGSYAGSTATLNSWIANARQYSVEPRYQKLYANLAALIGTVARALKIREQNLTALESQFEADYQLVTSLFYEAFAADRPKSIAVVSSDEKITELIRAVYVAMAHNLDNGLKKKYGLTKFGDLDIKVYTYSNGKFVAHTDCKKISPKDIAYLYQRILETKGSTVKPEEVTDQIDKIIAGYIELFGPPQRRDGEKPQVKSAIINYFTHHPNETLSIDDAIKITGNDNRNSVSTIMQRMAAKGELARTDETNPNYRIGPVLVSQIGVQRPRRGEEIRLINQVIDDYFKVNPDGEITTDYIRAQSGITGRKMTQVLYERSHLDPGAEGALVSVEPKSGRYRLAKLPAGQTPTESAAPAEKIEGQQVEGPQDTIPLNLSTILVRETGNEAADAYRKQLRESVFTPANSEIRGASRDYQGTIVQYLDALQKAIHEYRRTIQIAAGLNDSELAIAVQIELRSLESRLGGLYGMLPHDQIPQQTTLEAAADGESETMGSGESGETRTVKERIVSYFRSLPEGTQLSPIEVAKALPDSDKGNVGNKMRRLLNAGVLSQQTRRGPYSLAPTISYSINEAVP